MGVHCTTSTHRLTVGLTAHQRATVDIFNDEGQIFQAATFWTGALPKKIGIYNNHGDLYICIYIYDIAGLSFFGAHSDSISIYFNSLRLDAGLVTGTSAASAHSSRD